MDQHQREQRQHGRIELEASTSGRETRVTARISHRSSSGEGTPVGDLAVPLVRLEALLFHLGVDGKVWAGELAPDRGHGESIAFALGYFLGPVPPVAPLSLLVLDAPLSGMRERLRDWKD